IVVAVLAGGAIVFPSLALLFRLTLTGRFGIAETPGPAAAPREQVRPRVAPRLLVRAAAACLIAGFGLLSIAEASWAHAIGVVCLIAFVPIAFCAIVLPAVGGETAQPLGAAGKGLS